MEKATLAGGCFWCVENLFTDLPGIVELVSGYTGGETKHPTYEQVCTGKTGHFEAVEIIYQPDFITFLQLLDLYWRNIDPLDEGGQFFDRGPQYKTAIFYHSEKQKKEALSSKKGVEAFLGKAVATEILPASAFYPAESYHQGYCRKEPVRFSSYKEGHKKRLKELWKGAPFSFSDDLSARLTPLQYRVTQTEATEPPFNNPYCNTTKEGIYVDIVTGEPLFISNDKFASKSGWPSFTRPIDPGSIEELEDTKLGMVRREIVARKSGSHLGHVFPDGPPPTGLRYCLNSASLRFIPKEKLEEMGYGEQFRF